MFQKYSIPKRTNINKYVNMQSIKWLFNEDNKKTQRKKKHLKK